MTQSAAGYNERNEMLKHQQAIAKLNQGYQPVGTWTQGKPGSSMMFNRGNQWTPPEAWNTAQGNTIHYDERPYGYYATSELGKQIMQMMSGIGSAPAQFGDPRSGSNAVGNAALGAWKNSPRVAEANAAQSWGLQHGHLGYRKTPTWKSVAPVVGMLAAPLMGMLGPALSGGGAGVAAGSGIGAGAGTGLTMGATGAGGLSLGAAGAAGLSPALANAAWAPSLAGLGSGVAAAGAAGAGGSGGLGAAEAPFTGGSLLPEGSQFGTGLGLQSPASGGLGLTSGGGVGLTAPAAGGGTIGAGAAAGAGASGLGSVGNSIANAVKNFGFKDLSTALTGGLGIANSYSAQQDAEDLMNQLNEQMKNSDPFAQFRPEAIQMLKLLETNPEAYLNSPEVMAAKNRVEQLMGRQAAAGGKRLSGNLLQDLSDFSRQYDYEALNRRRAELAKWGGVDMFPNPGFASAMTNQFGNIQGANNQFRNSIGAMVEFGLSKLPQNFNLSSLA